MLGEAVNRPDPGRLALLESDDQYRRKGSDPRVREAVPAGDAAQH
jgi:hypothetical protein